MKHFYSTMAIILFATATNAQYKWSAGYQLMFGNSNKVETSITGSPYEESVPITNQFFLNRQISNHITLEAAAGYSTFKRTYYTNYLQMPPAATEDYLYQRIAVWNFSITAKYSVLQKKQFSLHIPLGVNNLLFSEKQRYTTAGTTYEWQGTGKTTVLPGQSIFTGVEADLNLSKRFYLNLQTNIGVFLHSKPDLIAAGTDSRGPFSFSQRAGIGYRF